MAATVISVNSRKSITVPAVTTSYNLGALPPTSFPADCLDRLWDFRTWALGYPWTYETQGCARSTCCPYGNFYTEGWAWMSSYYSPGVCPSQYRECRPPDGVQALPTSGGESIAFCCPTNYDCPASGSVYFACQSLLGGTTSVVVLDNIFDQSTVSTRIFSIPPEVTYAWSYQIAYPIQVRIKPGETPAPSTVASTASASAGDATSVTSTTTSTLPSAQSTSDSLSSGALAGIVIGSIVAGGLIVGLIIVLLWRRGRWTKDASHAMNGEKKDIQPSIREAATMKFELADDRVRPANELSAYQGSPWELDGHSPAPYEMQGAGNVGARLDLVWQR